MKKVGDVLQETGAGGGEDDVVHVQKQVRHGAATVQDEERRVGLGGDEAQRGEVAREAREPCVRRLFQAV